MLFFLVTRQVQAVLLQFLRDNGTHYGSDCPSEITINTKPSTLKRTS